MANRNNELTLPFPTIADGEKFSMMIYPFKQGDLYKGWTLRPIGALSLLLNLVKRLKYLNDYQYKKKAEMSFSALFNLF
ncbi:hypothetical protein [Shewanella surugensis]|uniref:Uncharacterized protein n=1 Tax=Shewanella surugensis TaxID=212020 RepID=A0ABT0LIN7_9GAMM|nr:hypothetical protein [Shewanella surugensis]MCL1127563.1 hypothetical protein [Shewanella surugensis]